MGPSKKEPIKNNEIINWYEKLKGIVIPASPSSVKAKSVPVPEMYTNPEEGHALSYVKNAAPVENAAGPPASLFVPQLAVT